MRTLFILLFTCLLCNSCITFQINQNGNETLPADERSRIHQFTPTTIYSFDQMADDSVTIEEISFSDIKALSEKCPFLWIHSFVPSCSHLNFEELKTLLQLEETNQDTLKLILLSDTYDINYLRYFGIILERPLIVYVLNHKDYPSNIGKAGHLLYKQLTTTNSKFIAKAKGRQFPDYLIKNGMLLKVRNWHQTLPDFIHELSDFRKSIFSHP